MLKLATPQRIIIGNTLIQYYIQDISRPIVCCFSAAGKLLTEKEASDSRVSAWGYDFFVRQGHNVISFNTIKENHFFEEPLLFDYVQELGQELVIFPKRYGYGASMGAYGATLHCESLNLDELLLITPAYFGRAYPVSSRYNGKFILIYDPFFSKDHQDVIQYPTESTTLKFYGVGHQVIESLAHIGYLKYLVLQFINSDGIDKNEFYSQIRKRKQLERYYSFLARNPTGKQTLKQRRVIRYYQLVWSLNNLGRIKDKITLKLTKSIRKKRNKYFQ